MTRMTAAPSRARPHPAVPSLLVSVLLGGLAPAPAAAATSPTPAQTAAAEAAAPDAPVVVYVVRHAEKADDGSDDPPLTVAGRIRVRVLQDLLADARLTHVYTTDWRRTRGTAEPIAESAGLEPVVYDPRTLDSLAQAIRSTPGRHLVVGHSNTTPALVAALGGDPSGPIHEMEYNRLYVVAILPGAGTAAVVSLLRFGEPYVQGQDFSLRAATSSAAAKGMPGDGN